MKKIYKFLYGLTTIFLVQYFCIFILQILKIHFPAPILGIVALFLLLKFQIIKADLIEDFCNFLLKYMILFFIPLFVGIITYYDTILRNFWAIILTIFITTALVMIITGLFVENIIKYKKLIKIKKGKI